MKKLPHIVGHTACMNDIAQAFAGHLGEVAIASISIVNTYSMAYGEENLTYLTLCICLCLALPSLLIELPHKNPLICLEKEGVEQRVKKVDQGERMLE
jgi:hypothetical protein